MGEECARIVRGLPRTADAATLTAAARVLSVALASARKLLEAKVIPDNSSGNKSRAGRHIQNSNTKPIIESEPAIEEAGTGAPAHESTAPSRQAGGFSLATVLLACPDIADYASGGVRDWPGMVDAARLVRGILGISPSAWADAVEVMGERTAAVTVAAMLQRSEAIRSAGGYLRRLVERARAGEYSVGPPIMALLKARGGGAGRRPGAGIG